MRVSELYGPVPQGEGALMGLRMPFLRLAGCNLACSWCDSAYAWRKGYSYFDLTPEAAAALLCAKLDYDLIQARQPWVSITGGEPTIYAQDVTALCDILRKRGVRAIIETNGLRYIDAFDLPNVFVSVSPKLPTSKQDTHARRERIAKLVARRDATTKYRTRTQYKFVIASRFDLDALPAYLDSVGISRRVGSTFSPIYLQPDGYIKPLEQYAAALDWLQESAPGWARVTPQLHRLVHGPDARGV